MSTDRAFGKLHVEINLGALRRNARMLRSQLGIPILFTLKKDAYGHGAVQCARVLEEESFAYFSVYHVEEGLELRESGIRTPILVFCIPESEGESKAAIQAGLTLTVTTPQSVRIIAGAARELSQRAIVHLKVDTGMGRVGLPAEDQAETLAALSGAPELDLEGVYSHLADSEDNEELTNQQTDRFCRLVASLSPRPRLCHLANSGGALRPSCRLDMARIGIALYGGTNLYETEPVMSAYAHLSQVRDYKVGETISYGATFIARHPMRAGIVPGGYGDGLIRSLSNTGSVMIRGKLAPIAGRVCMDQVVVDLTNIPEAREGDAALFFGSQNGSHFPPWKNAEAAGTIAYELTTLVGRLARSRVWKDSR